MILITGAAAKTGQAMIPAPPAPFGSRPEARFQGCLGRWGRA